MAAKSKHANSSRATSVSMLFLRFLQGKRCANFDSISLSLSLSGFRSIVRFERKRRKGRKEKKFKRNRKHVFQHSAPNIRVYLILDSSAIDAPKSPYRKTYYYSNCPDSDGQSHPLVASKKIHPSQWS